MDQQLITLKDGENFIHWNGERCWIGDENCEVDQTLMELQPINELRGTMKLMPVDIRIREVFRCAVQGVKPTVIPESQAERLVYRSIWDLGTTLKEEFPEWYFGFIPNKALNVFASHCIIGRKADGLSFAIEFVCGGKRINGDCPWFADQPGTRYNPCDVRACQVSLLYALSGRHEMGIPMVFRIKCDGESVDIRRELCDECYNLAAVSFAQHELTAWHASWLERMMF